MGEGWTSLCLAKAVVLAPPLSATKASLWPTAVTCPLSLLPHDSSLAEFVKHCQSPWFHLNPALASTDLDSWTLPFPWVGTLSQSLKPPAWQTAPFKPCTSNCSCVPGGHLRYAQWALNRPRSFTPLCLCSCCPPLPGGPSTHVTPGIMCSRALPNPPRLHLQVASPVSLPTLSRVRVLLVLHSVLNTCHFPLKSRLPGWLSTGQH